MKLSRLFQPRHPLFWLMVALNGLSALLGWLIQTQPLGTFAKVLVGVFALANALLGTWLAWQLVRDPAEPPNLPPN